MGKPTIPDADLLADYEEIAADTAREQEALEWAEALIADVADEPPPLSTQRRLPLRGRVRDA